jgi:hypothetical protein
MATSLHLQHLFVSASDRTAAWGRHSLCAHTSHPAVRLQRPCSGTVRLPAAGQPRLRCPTSRTVCKAAVGDGSAPGDDKGTAVELAEEGPSTDVAVIWGRLVKVGIRHSLRQYNAPSHTRMTAVGFTILTSHAAHHAVLARHGDKQWCKDEAGWGRRSHPGHHRRQVHAPMKDVQPPTVLILSRCFKRRNVLLPH